MNSRLAYCATAGLVLLTAAPSSAAQSNVRNAPDSRQTIEWSAAKKKQPVVRHEPRPAYAHRVPTYGRLNDPSLGPYGQPYRRPYDRGGCVIDEGYGRFSACPNE